MICVLTYGLIVLPAALTLFAVCLRYGHAQSLYLAGKVALTVGQCHSGGNEDLRQLALYALQEIAQFARSVQGHLGLQGLTDGLVLTSQLQCLLHIFTNPMDPIPLGHKVRVRSNVLRLGNIVKQRRPGISARCMGHCLPNLVTGKGQNGGQHQGQCVQHLIQYGLGGTELAYDGPAREEVIPQFLNECSIDGHYYAVPYMRSTEACYVNKTYVENLGYTLPDVLTWDFIWEVSEAATAQNADGTYVVNGQNVLIPFIYKSTDNMMIQMLKQKNAGYSTADGSIELFNDTTTDLLYGIAGHVKSGAFSTFKISGYPANFLNAGQCIFAIDSTAGATWMGTDAPLSDISEDSLVQFETAVRMIPQFDPEHPEMISQGPSVCVFNKSDSQEVLASWLFAQYLLTNDVQIAYSETEGYVPVTSKAQNSAEYQEYLSECGADNSTHYAVKIEASKLLLDNVDSTFVTPVFNGSASLRDASGQLIENVVKSTRRKETVDDAYMQKLYSDVESLYRLGQGSDASFGKKELGAMPRASVILLSTLAVTWVLILLYVGWEYLKNRKK